MKVAGKTVKKTKADKYEEEIVPASDEEQPQEPKPKKMKVKVCDEINIAVKKIEDGTQGTWNKYGDMVKSMSGMQAEDGPSRKPASKMPLQDWAVGGRRLRREGAIADINALYDQVVTPTPDLSTNRSDLMEINNRYILLTYTLMFSLLTLDQSTLFYWMLSDSSLKKRKHASAIKEWALAVPATARATSGSKAPFSLARSDIPPLTSGTSRSSASSVLTDSVKIISHRALDSVEVKAELAPTLSLHTNGGLSDNDERRGEEREAAINSPPKGKKRVTSDVSLF
jgi:hypothetical protein